MTTTPEITVACCPSCETCLHFPLNDRTNRPHAFVCRRKPTPYSGNVFALCSDWEAVKPDNSELPCCTHSTFYMDIPTGTFVPESGGEPAKKPDSERISALEAECAELRRLLDSQAASLVRHIGKIEERIAKIEGRQQVKE